MPPGLCGHRNMHQKRRRYDAYLETAPKVPRTPWGTEREYGGSGSLNLPDSHRTKAEPLTLMGKGHRHFGYGGHILPSAKQIRVPFPIEHPYYSHISKFAVFPNFLSPNDPHTGVRAGQLLPINPDMPAKIPDVTVSRKIKGFPYRYETQEIPTQAKSVAWPGQEGYSQIPKSTKEQKQIYPTPPKLIAPNRSERAVEHTISERTANMLKNIEKSHWLTMYKREFTGSGPMNPIQLDDYFEKEIAKVTGKSNYFAELFINVSANDLCQGAETIMHNFIHNGSHHLDVYDIARDYLKPNSLKIEAGQREQSHPAFLPNAPLRPLKREVRSKKGFTDDDIDYQYTAAPPISPSAPARDSLDAKSQLPICETDPKPKVETVMCREKGKFNTWQNRRCQTAISASASCPDYDMRLLRYKVQQMKDSDKPSAFSQHLEERVRDCWATPVKGKERACIITDFEHAQSPWRRPKSVQDDISYADLPQSKLFGFTTKENHMALSKPPPPNRVENNEEDTKCHNEINFASGDTRAICTSYVPGNKEMFESIPQPQLEKGNLLICDDPKLQVSKLKFPHAFNKTEVHKHLHEIVPEKTVDYRDNIYSGRRHTFFGLNSSYFHNGTF
ncbi:sperm-associated microtubule inner protein 4 [Mustelus asterias]